MHHHHNQYIMHQTVGSDYHFVAAAFLRTLRVQVFFFAPQPERFYSVPRFSLSRDSDMIPISSGCYTQRGTFFLPSSPPLEAESAGSRKSWC